MRKDRDINLLVDDSRMLGLKLCVRGDVPRSTLKIRIQTEADAAAFIDLSPKDLVRVGKRLQFEGQRMLNRKEDRP